MEGSEMFMKGINHGYIMASEAPKMYAEHLNSFRGESPYIEGFKQGKKVALEMELKVKTKKKNKGKGLGR